MRRVLGVTMSEALPGPLEAGDLPRVIDEDTMEVAPDVDFGKPVTHPMNIAFLRRVAELAQAKTKVSHVDNV
jgi:hypothetical protein